MKRLRISSLMDEYTDTEFFPTGGSAVDPKAVKERVLAQAMAAAPTRRKQKMPRKKKILLAAALAAALVLLVGAGYPFFQQQLVNGSLSFEQKDGEKMTSFVHYGELVKYEDGRLIFNRNGGQRIDITDLVSEETPYIYDASDPDTGMVYYIVMGGTPESFGWFEWIQTPYPFDDDLAFSFDEDGNPVTIIYDFEFAGPEIDNYGVCGMGYYTFCLDDFDPPLWLLSAIEELDIPVRDSPECE